MSGSIDERVQQYRSRVVPRRIKEETADHYERWIRRFEAFTADVEEPTLGHVEDFDSLLFDEGRNDYPWTQGNGKAPPDSYAYQTRTLALSAVKSWLRREYGVDIIEQPQTIALGEPSDFSPTYLTMEEVQQTIAEADDACLNMGCEAALRLSYDAILRASELVQVRREDIDFEDGSIYVRATKGSRQSEVGLQQSTLDALREYIELTGREGHLFLNSRGEPYTANAWTSHFLTCHHDAGSHAFGRHSPIYHLLEQGEPFGDVYRRARHRNPDVTASYARKVGANVPDWGDV